MLGGWRRLLEIVAIGKDERGQGLVEYGLIILLVAIAIIASLELFGNELVLKYNDISKSIP